MKTVNKNRFKKLNKKIKTNQQKNVKRYEQAIHRTAYSSGKIYENISKFINGEKIFK